MNPLNFGGKLAKIGRFVERLWKGRKAGAALAPGPAVRTARPEWKDREKIGKKGAAWKRQRRRRAKQRKTFATKWQQRLEKNMMRPAPLTSKGAALMWKKEEARLGVAVPHTYAVARAVQKRILRGLA